MRRLVALLLVTAAACSGGTSTVTTAAGTAPTTTPVEGTQPSLTVPPSSVTPTTLPSREELSEPQVVYLLLDSPTGRVLVPVWRDETSPQGVKGSIEALFAGPTPSERLGVPAISTSIPAEAAVIGVSVVNELATVDLTAEFYAGGPPPERLAQVVYTATRFDGVTAVAFRVAGEPFTGLPGGADRSSFVDVIGSVFVEEPAYGAPAEQPGRLLGEGNGDLSVLVTDEAGLTVADFEFAASGTFDRPLAYSVSVDQPGSMVVSDGTSAVTYPVQLRLPEAHSATTVSGLSKRKIFARNSSGIAQVAWAA